MHCYDSAMQGDYAVAVESPTWLSGPILTFINKLVMPVAWFCFVTGVPAWVFITTGRISIARDFYPLVAFTLVTTVLLSWFTAHLQLVGYQGRHLIVANYWKKALIPFRQVEAVESVWWYKGRAVRIRFTEPTAFGSTVYYMPKWALFGGMFSKPEEDLQSVLSNRD
ncbi:hypothetical protein [Paludibaculum fermentans]|uniref:hypothetical protein n=1 Tax=Paludibaculum fermentans TaxID=1473598 RepID=UPI003EBCEF6A